MTIVLSRHREGVACHWGEADALQRAALVLGTVLLAAAILAPWLAPFDPDDQSLIARLRPPLGFERAREGHLLGTDALGRDVLSRTLHGLRLTLGLAFAGATIGLVLGTALGLLAGLGPGWVDDAVMAAVDAQIAIPFTLVALLILAVFGSSLTVMVCVLGVAGWEQYARIVRGEVRRILSMPFIEGARAGGLGGRCRSRGGTSCRSCSRRWWCSSRWPCRTSCFWSRRCLSWAWACSPPPRRLGSMVGTGRDYLPTAPWIVLAPAAAILLVTFAVQILGDWLRDRADPPPQTPLTHHLRETPHAETSRHHRPRRPRRRRLGAGADRGRRERVELPRPGPGTTRTSDRSSTTTRSTR